MKQLSLALVLALGAASPALAMNNVQQKSSATSTAQAEAPKGRIVISVSGREGGSAAALARWHFAQGQSGEGARRFAAD